MKASFLPASRRAFTLVEILVVLAIISMIMFFTVPNMGEIIQGKPEPVKLLLTCYPC